MRPRGFGRKMGSCGCQKGFQNESISQGLKPPNQWRPERSTLKPGPFSTARTSARACWRCSVRVKPGLVSRAGRCNGVLTLLRTAEPRTCLKNENKCKGFRARFFSRFCDFPVSVMGAAFDGWLKTRGVFDLSEADSFLERLIGMQDGTRAREASIAGRAALS